MNRSEEIRQLIFLTEKVKSNFQAILKKVSKDHNVTVQQMMVLMAINHIKVSTVGELAEMFQLHQANVSTLVKAMEADGMLVREVKDDDVRVHLLTLSPDAKKLVKKMYLELDEKILEAQGVIDFEKIKEGLNEMSNLLERIL